MPTHDTQRRIVVCDASPLIFLAKLDALALLGQVVPGRLIVLQNVCNVMLDAAVDHHGLRISIALYRRILEALAGHNPD